MEINFNVREYLESVGLSKVHSVGDNVMACCPFHNDSSPSFGVSSDTGVYQCFGCGAKGTLPQLVKHLSCFDTVGDAEEYLIAMFGVYSMQIDEPLELRFPHSETRLEHYIPEDMERKLLSHYTYRHPYLGGRGITEKWQRLFGIGYSKISRAITIPYRDHKGRLLSVKFRKTSSKAFWYDPPIPGHLKAETLWGLDKVLKWGLKKVAIVEGEIDALSVWQAEIVGAVAIGGNQFTDKHVRRLTQSLPYDAELIIFTDNDVGGSLAKNLIKEKLLGKFPITEIDWSLVTGCPKDANDLETEQIRFLLNKRLPSGIDLIFSADIGGLLNSGLQKPHR